MRRKKHDISHIGVHNLPMNDDTYRLRRQVLAFVYEAKNLLRANGRNMPRQNVRIATSERGNVMGVAKVGKNAIWINPSFLNIPENDQRMLVYHEMVHSITGFGHDDNCPLMCPVHKMANTPKAKADALFLAYIVKYT